MRVEEYMNYDGTGLAQLVHRGEVDAAELTEAAIERIDALNPSLNAVVERHDEAARAQARSSPRSAPLCGVPFLAKDLNIEVAGMRLTFSCRWLQGLPPATRDSPLAQRWREAGLSHPRPDQHARIRSRVRDRADLARPDVESLGPQAQSRRVERRRGGGGRLGDGSDRARHRLGRLHSRAGGGLWSGRTEAEPRLGARRGRITMSSPVASTASTCSRAACATPR